MAHINLRDASSSSENEEYGRITVGMFQAPVAVMRLETSTPTITADANKSVAFFRSSGQLAEADLSKTIQSFAGLRIPPVQNRGGYLFFNENRTVRRILEEIDLLDKLLYKTKFEDYHTEMLSYEALIEFDNGREALRLFLENAEVATSDSDDPKPSVHSPNSLQHLASTLIGPAVAQTPSDDDEDSKWVLNSPPKRLSAPNGTSNDNTKSDFSELITSESGDSDLERLRYTRKSVRVRNLRSVSRQKINLVQPYREDGQSTSDEDFPELGSDILPMSRKRKRGKRRFIQFSADLEHKGMKFDRPRRPVARRSTRTTRHQNNMEEIGMDDVYRSESDREHTGTRIAHVREDFQPLPRSSIFYSRHSQQCDTCGTYGSNARGQLIQCQGCSISYHKSCLGVRSTRDHLVTKIGDANYVLQCRRCIGMAKKRDPTAPDQGMCQVCCTFGEACKPFRIKKTPSQEEKEREQNGGQDVVIHVDASRINGADNVLFRCSNCWRGFHYHHLPPRTEMIDLEIDDDRGIAVKRAHEYCRDWLCKECAITTSKVAALVAWRPVNVNDYRPGDLITAVNDDDKEYLIKWKDLSYFQCQWMPGAWTWGVVPHMMRSAFIKKIDAHGLPSMHTEDAIPEEYLRVDIVLDVKFTSKVETRIEEVEKARIREVDQAFVKYKGLGYEDVVWEKPPEPEDAERWSDFVSAYDNWVMGRHVKLPKSLPLKIRLEKARSVEFSSLEKKKQPVSLNGGELMNYQLEGVNWLYYRWYQLQNAILADEMGLGKTVQVIGLLATLFEDHHCFPFLIVVPNSTCPNWRRELKKWAPSLRVVTYFGSAIARTTAFQYEIYPEGSKELRCHVVVTSYETAADDSCWKFFESVPWQGLIVDEGQRLKNDKNQLYNSLSKLKIPFRVLLTGTPLQNNARELFNLLQFLDDGFDAVALALEYEELTNENVPKLHNLIRPFFLRRTKAQVLTFLPLMAQIIIPVSMSMLQRKVYSSILSKNPELLKAIFRADHRGKHSEGVNLNNILMQLRKCLCHPFVYSKSIEDRNLAAAVSHRNLVEASSKLQLLEILLPKLRERGHRVLIFSQFLEMLDIVEDFLDGLELRYQRLDGTITSLQKQKRIDEFNSPDSPIFAFLLSTRAGGVGINLASADTVIILDPDFNPHRDIQALSRAHRIGQTKKVICFQLMTRGSAEEKIMQIGRKKMAQTHILIERMDAEEDDSIDMESILRFGAADILKGDEAPDSRYDDISVEKLLDRSQIESTKAGEDHSAESQFSFARVWENEATSMIDSLGNSDEDEKAPDPTVWEQILKDRERIAAEEATTRFQTLGRGRRARQVVDYSKATAASNVDDVNSDTDFRGEDVENSDDEMSEDIDAAEIDDASTKHPRERKSNVDERTRIDFVLSSQKQVPEQLRVYHGTTASNFPHHGGSTLGNSNAYSQVHQHASKPSAESLVSCFACGSRHKLGYCPLKLAGPEYCNLCGLAHYGMAGRVCPHVRSETQVRQMLEALRNSSEPQHLKSQAIKYLRGVKGTIVQAKKAKAMLAAAATDHVSGQPFGQPSVKSDTKIDDTRPVPPSVVSNGPMSTNPLAT